MVRKKEDACVYSCSVSSVNFPNFYVNGVQNCFLGVVCALSVHLSVSTVKMKYISKKNPKNKKNVNKL